MRYFMTQITTISGQTAIATFEQVDIASAKSAYYSALASAYANPNLEFLLAYIENQKGEKIVSEQYEKPTPVVYDFSNVLPEPEPEEPETPEEPTDGE